MSKRTASLESGTGIDFATAEGLAIGSLLQDGKHVRLCGQDSGRVRSLLVSQMTPLLIRTINRGLSLNGMRSSSIK